jgi:hypothetical protein
MAKSPNSEGGKEGFAARRESSCLSAVVPMRNRTRLPFAVFASIEARPEERALHCRVSAPTTANGKDDPPPSIGVRREINTAPVFQNFPSLGGLYHTTVNDDPDAQTSGSSSSVNGLEETVGCRQAFNEVVDEKYRAL